MPRQHDADLCERIRKLETRVKELEAEARPSTVYLPPMPHYCWPGCPTHYGTWWYTNTSTPMPPGTTITYDSDSTAQSTYTLTG